MSKRHLCVMLVGPLPPPAGGMANQTQQLSHLLQREGVLIDLVQVNRPYRPAWVGRLRGIRAAFRLLPYLVRLWRGARRSDVVHLMANSGWSWHLFAAPAIIIGRLLGRPVIVNYRGGHAAEFLAKQHSLVAPVLRMARVIVVPSGFLEEVFQDYGIQTTIVPNIVDLELFADQSRERAPLLDAPHLVVTRNLEAIYDIDTALHAFARVRRAYPAARLTIAGTGPERERLSEEVGRLGLTNAVRFTGRLERADIAALYSSAHIMLNPSTVDNTPNSVLEAWASGVVVVSTNVGGVPYLANDGVDAVLVPSRDPESMAEAVMSLLASPERMEALRQAGGCAAERFTWAHVGEQWLGLYRALAEAESGGAQVERSDEY